MCLSSRLTTREEVDALIPGDEFYCYKIVNATGGGTLVSPSYSHHSWHVGENVSDGVNRGNGDVGIYVFLAPLGVKLTKNQDGSYANANKHILRVKCKRGDVVWAGKDRWGSNEGTCLVMKKVEISEQDFKNALDPNFTQADVLEVVINAKETIKKSEKTVGKIKKKAKKTAKVTKEKVTKKKAAAKKKGKKIAEKVKKKVAKKATNHGFDKMTVDQLKTVAKQRKIRGYSKMTKKELVVALRK